MHSQTTRTLMTGGALIFAALVAVRPAAAEHRYTYSGKCYNYHGEVHMIHALENMDRAFLATARHQKILATIDARRELMTAFRESCQHETKKTLLGAVRSLNRFIGTCDVAQLDIASERIARAMYYEQLVHQPVVQRPPIVVPSVHNPDHSNVRSSRVDVRTNSGRHGRGHSSPRIQVELNRPVYDYDYGRVYGSDCGINRSSHGNYQRSPSSAAINFWLGRLF